MARRLIRFLTYAGLVSIYLILTLLLLGLMISQTDWFREKVRQRVEQAVNESIHGRLTIGAVSGNFFSRLSIHDISLTGPDSLPVLQAKELKIRYMPLFLVFNNLSLSEISFIDPGFTVLEDSLNGWNLSRLTDATADDSTDSEPLDLMQYRIRVGLLRIQNGTVRFRTADGGPDSLALLNRFNYSDFHFTNLHLRSSLTFRPDAVSSFNIHDLSVRDSLSGFTLKQFRLLSRYDQKALTADSLLVETGNTRLSGSARFSLPDFFRFSPGWSDRIPATPFEASIRLDPFHFKDLTTFLSVVDMVHGPVRLGALVRGTLDTLTVKSVTVGLGDSTRLAIDGTIYHLTDIDRMSFDLNLLPSTAYSSDLSALLKTLPLPDFRRAGLVNLSGAYRGNPLNFSARISVDSESAGSATGSVSMDMTQPVTRYQGTVQVRSVNPSGWLGGNPALDGDITGVASIGGEGFTIDDIQTKGSVRISDSRWGNYRIDSLTTTLNGRPGELDYLIRLVTNAGTLAADGFLISDEGILRNHGELYLDQLNLNMLVPSLAVTSISGETAVDMMFSDTTDISATAFFSEWVIGGYDFGTSSHDIQFYNIRGERFDLSLLGSWLNIQLRGSQDIDYWVQHGLATLESIPRWMESDSVSESETPAPGWLTPADLNWSWTIKSVIPVLSLVKAPMIAVAGKGSGKTTVRGGESLASLDIRLDSLQIENSLKIKNLGVIGLLDSINIVSALRHSIGSLTFTADRIESVNRNWGQADILLWLNNGTISVSSELNDPTGLVSGLFDFDLTFQPDLIQLNLIQFVAKLKPGDWVLEDICPITFTGKALSIDNFRLSSPYGLVSISGGLDEDGSDQLRIEGSGISPSRLVSAFSNDLTVFPGGTVSFAVDAIGTLQNPMVSATAAWDQISMGKTIYGDLSALASVDGGYLTYDARLTDPSDRTAFVSRGFYPVLPAVIPDESKRNQMRADLEALDFDLSLFQNLIPGVSQLKGLLRARLTVAGSVEKPNLSGEVGFTDGQVRLTSTNVTYRNISGSAAIANDIIRIRSIDAWSGESGQAKLYGSFRLKNYLPSNDLNLTLVLNNLPVLNKTPSPSEIYYGAVDLTGTVTLKGSYEKSAINGNVRIRRAALTVVTATANQRTENEDSFISFVNQSDLRPTGEEANGTTGKTETIRFPLKKKEKGFASGLSAFLQVDASQNAYLTIILNRATGEQLQTELNGNLTIQYQNEDLTANGALNVNSGFYNFYTTQFQVEQGGAISWTGDPVAPELNLVAKTTISRFINTDPAKPVSENNVISLGIKGAVQEPVLSYDIVSTRTTEESELTRSTLTDPAMKDKAPANIISLLLIGQWLYDPFTEGSNLQFNLQDDITSTTLNAGFGVLSNHIGRFLGGVDNKIRYVNFKVDNQGGKAENIGGTFVYDISENWSFTGGLSYNLSDERTNLTGQTSANRLGLSWRLENKLTNSLSWDIFQNYDPYTFDTNEQIVRGVSLFYRTNFYRWADLFRRQEERDPIRERSERENQTGNPPVP
ncbi:MAG: translocation/assembly module TamB domain-containing protein [Bacteroidetes bacterium]|nr:translocation/assembly module TamB domain-containing protein [Bacteroidota bacterium]